MGTMMIMIQNKQHLKLRKKQRGSADVQRAWILTQMNTLHPVVVDDKPLKKDKKKIVQVVEEKQEEPELDAAAKKVHLQKLVEEADADIAMDLFGGAGTAKETKRKEEEEKLAAAEATRKAKAKEKIQYVDAFDQLELKTQASVEDLCSNCTEKIRESTKDVSLKYLTEIFKRLQDDCELKELEEIENVLKGIVKARKNAKATENTKVNKANTKINKTTKFNTASEWADVYGDDDYDDYTQEEWDAWNAQA